MMFTFFGRQTQPIQEDDSLKSYDPTPQTCFDSQPVVEPCLHDFQLVLLAVQLGLQSCDNAVRHLYSSSIGIQLGDPYSCTPLPPVYEEINDILNERCYSCESSSKC
jgi:hypothetical protein